MLKRHGVTQSIYTLMSSKEVNKITKEEQIRYDEQKIIYNTSGIGERTLKINLLQRYAEIECSCHN